MILSYKWIWECEYRFEFFILSVCGCSFVSWAMMVTREWRGLAAIVPLHVPLVMAAVCSVTRVWVFVFNILLLVKLLQTWPREKLLCLYRYFKRRYCVYTTVEDGVMYSDIEGRFPRVWQSVVRQTTVVPSQNKQANKHFTYSRLAS